MFDIDIIGRVRIARHSKTGQYAAVKIVSKHPILNSRLSMRNLGDEAERILRSIEREIVIMKLIEHPNIMKLYDVWETSTELFLILEYVEGGELFEYLCNKGRLPTSEALGYFQQIINAVHYCHSFNIAHRDLKPENLLLDRDKNIKVADFGMAIWQGKSDFLSTSCGSPHYAAPEVISGHAYQGTSADVWSCGIVLFALLAGRLPFDDEDLATLLEKVKIGRYEMPRDIDPRAQDLINKMLQKEVARRITLPEILKHPFFTSQAPKAAHQIPTLETIARPLKNRSDVDPDIFNNLKTLWPGIPDGVLTANLTNKKPTWEKGVYHLLLRYREKHLEDYDEEEEQRLAAERASRRREKKAVGKTRLEQALEALPLRTGPPTPRRASGRQDRSSSPSPTPGPSNVRRGPLMDHAFTPEGSLFASSPNGPVSPLLDAPELQDETIQQFFRQIVNHLNVMQNSPGSATSPMLDPLLSPMMAKVASPTPLTVDPGRPFTPRRDTQPTGDVFAFGNSRGGNTPATRPLTIRRPRSAESAISNKENGLLPQDSSYLTVDYHHFAGQGSSAQTPPRDNGKKSSLRSNKNSKNGRHVQIAEPPEYRLSKLRKKRSTAMGSSYSSPTSSAFSVSDAGNSFTLATAPKRSRWLGNLFKFKPATYQLVSNQDVYRTRYECRRLLENMGLTVLLTQAEGMGVLKCSLPDSKLRDSSGTVTTIKGVKFRVEVQKPSSVQAIAGFQVVLALVLEKGAATSFKMVYNRLRREWEMDTPPRGYMVESPGSDILLTDDERFVEVVYSN